MSIQTIASRYATALLEEAERNNIEVEVEQDIVIIRQYLKSSADLRTLFRSPVIVHWRKREAVRAVFSGHVTELTLKFLMLVVTKRREIYVAEMFQSFHEQLDLKRNLLRVNVHTATPLDDDSKDKLQKALSTKTGMSVIPTYAQDPALIGGVVVTIRDSVIDGSLRQKLAKLKDRLVNN